MCMFQLFLFFSLLWHIRQWLPHPSVTLSQQCVFNSSFQLCVCVVVCSAAFHLQFGCYQALLFTECVKSWYVDGQ